MNTPYTYAQKPCLYIATIEKANGLVNWLIENKKLERIGLIVLDELHFLSEDSHRCVHRFAIITNIGRIPFPTLDYA